MATQAQRTETTKEAIVDGAIRSYLGAGNIDVPLDVIATEAGVAKATILYHFESRIGLLGSVADHLLSKFVERLGSLDRFASPAEGIRAYLEQGFEPTASLFTQVGDALTYAGLGDIGAGLDRLAETLRHYGVKGSPIVSAAAMQTMMRQIAFGYVDVAGLDAFMAEIVGIL